MTILTATAPSHVPAIPQAAPAIDYKMTVMLSILYDEVDPSTYQGVLIRWYLRTEQIGDSSYKRTINTGNPQADFSEALRLSWHAHMLLNTSSVGDFQMDGGDLDTERAFQDARDSFE